MIVSHEFALQKASQASCDGNYMEGICFSLLALAISDGLRNSPTLGDHGHSHLDAEVASLAHAFFSNPTDPAAFETLQNSLSRWGVHNPNG